MYAFPYINKIVIEVASYKQEKYDTFFFIFGGLCSGFPPYITQHHLNV
jgi:hypothetical protein